MTKKQRKQLEKYMKTAIYFVTCLNPKIDRKGHYVVGGHKRCWGWYHDLEEAVKSVEENHNDIHENEFPYAVIEKVPEGTVPMCVKEMHWFKWHGTQEIGVYKKCGKPDWSKGTCDWAY
jgi:hypothetical protein